MLVQPLVDIATGVADYRRCGLTVAGMGRMKGRVTGRPASKAEGADKSKRRGTDKSRPAAGFERVFEKVYRLVLKIPAGRVMTYGQIARLLEDRYSPRLVGWAMHAVPSDKRNIPWHRVINSRGGTSTGKIHPAEPDLQRWMLEAEGVAFDERGCCDLAAYQWSPRPRPRGGTPATGRKQGKSTAAGKKKR
jgi:methylated-DNA-protein-cysteine methyltransferase-like protein